MRLKQLPRLETEHLIVKLLEPSQAAKMLAFREENRDFLLPWEPARPPEFFTRGFWQLQLQHNLNECREGRSLCFSLLDPDEAEVQGVCNFTNIVWGTFRACHLGYAMAERHQGKGLMREALSASITYLFEELRLHRIMANYMPHNERSGRLLTSLGFQKEGFAEKFLSINGRWEDHVLTALVNPRD